LTLLGFIASAVAAPTVASAAPQADVALTKSDSPDPVQQGSVLTYTVTVENLGPARPPA